MRKGDLSNKVSPRVIIRMNETMFDEVPKKGVVNKIKDKLGLPLTTEYQIKWPTMYFIERLVMETNYNVHLVFIQNEDKGFGDKVNIIDHSTLTHLNILTYREVEPLYRLLDTPKTYLVDTSCVRSNIYTLDEAIHIFN